VLQLLENNHPSPPSNHKPISALIKRPTRLLRRVIKPRAQRSHAVEHARELPSLVLPRSTERNVALPELNLLHPRADAVRAGGARGGDGVRGALELESGGEHSGDGGPHGPGDAEGPDLVLPAGGAGLYGVYCLGDVLLCRTHMCEPHEWVCHTNGYATRMCMARVECVATYV